MADFFDQVEAYLESVTNFPHFLVLVISFGLVILLSHGVISAFRHAVKKGKSNLASILLLVLGAATMAWADTKLGLFMVLVGVLLALRKTLRRIFQRRRSHKGAA